MLTTGEVHREERGDDELVKEEGEGNGGEEATSYNNCRFLSFTLTHGGGGWVSFTG